MMMMLKCQKSANRLIGLLLIEMWCFSYNSRTNNTINVQLLAGFCGPGFPEHGPYNHWIPVHYTLEIKCETVPPWKRCFLFQLSPKNLYPAHLASLPFICQPFVLSSSVCVYACTLGSMCVRMCVLTLLSAACWGTTLRPFAAWAPRWLIEHSVMSPPFHWGPSQSAQARLLNRCPHRHHSPILDESSFRGLKGLFQRLAERWRALLPLIQHQATGLFTFFQPHWLILRACDSAPCGLLIKSCQVPCIYDAAIGIHILCAGFKARLQLLQSKPMQA